MENNRAGIVYDSNGNIQGMRVRYPELSMLLAEAFK